MESLSHRRRSGAGQTIDPQWIPDSSVSQHRRLVTFLIAGVQKGGTTALADYLRQHPALFIPALKELHLFDNEDLNWQHPEQIISTYHAFFQDAPAGKLWGEATPIYSYWWPAMARIWAYNPAMRVILCLRNPVERAYSHWAMETGRAWDSLPFPQAIASESERCRAALPLQHRVFSYVSRGFYSEQLRRLWSFFPPGANADSSPGAAVAGASHHPCGGASLSRGGAAGAQPDLAGQPRPLREPHGPSGAPAVAGATPS